MYTTYSAGHAESRFPYPFGTGKGGHKPGHQTVRTQKTPARRKPYGFLNRTLQPIAPDLYTETYRGRVNLTTEESFDYLYRSALNYVQLLEMELPYTPPSKASPREKICRLYQVLDASLTDHVNLEVRKGQLRFCIYRYHSWPDYTLFWLPVNFTEKLHGTLKRIVLEFIRRFIRHHRMQDITDTPYFEMAECGLDCYLEEIMDRDELKRQREKNRIFRSYSEGKISRCLKRMRSRAFCRKLEEQVRQYVPVTKAEGGLLELIREGLPFIAASSPCIMDYEYDWHSEEEPDFMPIPMGYQILLTYSNEDELTDELESYFTSDSQETYCLTPVSGLLITPQTEKPLPPDDFPERFAKWLSRFMDYIANRLND